jgi:sialic acid synthase SpsE
VEKYLGNGNNIRFESPQRLIKQIAWPDPARQVSADNITAKRPGAGISPMRWDEVLGQVAQKDYEKDELI